MVSGWWGKGAPSTIKSVYPNFLGVNIHAAHLMTDFSQDGRLNQADITDAKYRNFHASLSQTNKTGEPDKEIRPSNSAVFTPSQGCE
jgi:hypothetical protein